MRRVRWIGAVLVALVMGIAGCGSSPETVAAIRVSLSEGLSCADFCVDTVVAEIRALDPPISLGRSEGPCGREIRFENVPAGVRVRVSIQASRGGDPVLEGVSQELTVVAGEEIPASVALEPLAQPTVAAVEPDPVPETAGDQEFEVVGEGFGDGGGLSQVELDGIPLTSKSWSPTRVTASLSPKTTGRYLRLRACGVGSVPRPIRMVSGSWKTLQPAGCAGLVFVDAEPLPGRAEMVLAAACATPDESYLQRLKTTTCDLAANRILLPGRPAVVAAMPDASAVWVGLTVRPALVVVGTADDTMTEGPDLGPDVAPIALSMLEGAVYAVVAAGDDRKLLRIQGGNVVEIPGIAPDLVLRSLAVAPGKVLVPARDPQGLGKLVMVATASGLVTEVVLPDCPEPDRIAVGASGAWAAVTCAGPAAGILGLNLAKSEPVFVPLSGSTPTDMVIDAAGDVAFAWTTEGNLVGISLRPGGTPVASFRLAPSEPRVPLARFPGDHRMLLGGPDAGSFTILSPYAGQSPCGDGGPG